MKTVLTAALSFSALLSALLSRPASAHAGATQWTQVASASGSSTYLDRASIRKSGDGYRAATLVSFSTAEVTPDGTRYRSMKAQHQYSCDERTATLLSQTYYPQPMGKGPVAQSFKYEKFSPEDAVPGSAAEGALRIICARHPPSK